MKRFPKCLRAIAVMVAAAFGFLTVIVAPVQAAMVGTQTILEAGDVDTARQKVKMFLERREVAERLQNWGVSSLEADTRIDAMTAEEVSVLAQQIDRLPAGGADALGFVLLIALISFVVLVILDIVGVTDIFTFIKKR